MLHAPPSTISDLGSSPTSAARRFNFAIDFTIANTSDCANVHPPGERRGVQVLRRKEGSAWPGSLNAIETSFPAFVHPRLRRNNAARWMFASTRNGVAGRAAPSGRWSVWTRPTMGSTWPAFLREADPRAGPPLLTLHPTTTPLKPGVTVPALKQQQLAAARVACSYRPDSLPDGSPLNTSRPASRPGTPSDCKTRSRVEEKKKKLRRGRENRPLFFSGHSPYLVLSALSFFPLWSEPSRAAVAHKFP